MTNLHYFVWKETVLYKRNGIGTLLYLFQFYHFPVHILPSHTKSQAKRLEDTLSDVNNITETNTADQPT